MAPVPQEGDAAVLGSQGGMDFCTSAPAFAASHVLVVAVSDRALAPRMVAAALDARSLSRVAVCTRAAASDLATSMRARTCVCLCATCNL